VLVIVKTAGEGLIMCDSTKRYSNAPSRLFELTNLRTCRGPVGLVSERESARAGARKRDLERERASERASEQQSARARAKESF
jgi:hypothetical protein